jgi:AcrR family transcriptional regulator
MSLKTHGTDLVFSVPINFGGMMENENELRDRILEIAKGKFKTHGYRGVKTDDIASEAGISKRTLYQHFKSKEYILREVILRENSRIHDIIVEKADIIAQGETRLIDLNESIILDTILEPINFFDSATIMDMKKNMHSLIKEIEEPCHNKIFIAFSKLFQACKDRGFIKKEINSDLFFTAVHGAISDLLDNQRHLTLNMTKESMVRQTLEMMTLGVLTPEANKGYIENNVRL